MIDDLLIELVDVLNQKEHEKMFSDQRELVMKYFSDMLKDLGQLDGVQKQVDIRGGHLEPSLNLAQISLTDNEILNKKDSVEFQSYLQNVGKSYGIANYLKHAAAADDVLGYGRYKLANFVEDGPYECPTQREQNVQLELDPEFLMFVVRDQIVKEDLKNEQQYMTKIYCDGMESISNKLVEDLLSGVLAEVSKAEEEFVTQVLKSELN